MNMCVYMPQHGHSLRDTHTHTHTCGNNNSINIKIDNNNELFVLINQAARVVDQ
uniref:Uncharacterized protein n=1 Tax=Octopus bimaculoides TaxID=37653 RepID=A0A0L8GPP3_OCTBM